MGNWEQQGTSVPPGNQPEQKGREVAKATLGNGQHELGKEDDTAQVEHTTNTTDASVKESELVSSNTCELVSRENTHPRPSSDIHPPAVHEQLTTTSVCCPQPNCLPPKEVSHPQQNVGGMPKSLPISEYGFSHPQRSVGGMPRSLPVSESEEVSRLPQYEETPRPRIEHSAEASILPPSGEVPKALTVDVAGRVSRLPGNCLLYTSPSPRD